jgi:Fe-S-cluster containining protein
MPAYLIPGDLERITESFSVDGTIYPQLMDVLMNFFAASPGALVAKMVKGKPSLFRIPTIVPRTCEDGRCIFMDESNRCTIHDVAPYGCGWFDFHMNREMADERSHAGLTTIIDDEINGSGDYRKYWKVLHDAGHRTLSPEEKKKALLT